MKKLLAVLIVTSSLLLSSLVYAQPKFDLTFGTNDGKIIVVDTFGTIRKSNVSVEDVAKMLNEMRRMQQKIEELEKKVRELERKR